MNTIPSTDLKITLGDFNAQIGKGECYREVVGVHSLHTLSNDNGARVINFVTLACPYAAHNSTEKTYIRSPGDQMTEGQINRLIT